jgi:23S rRNA pseudouridine2605 synthase
VASAPRTLCRGVRLEDGPARVDAAVRLSGAGGQAWLELTLSEGRYREVKRLCRGVGLRVLRLVRVRFGPLQLGALERGAWRDLTAREVKALQAVPEAG